MMKTIFNTLEGDQVEFLPNKFVFERGLNLTYSYRDSRNKYPLPFVGNSTFLGLDGHLEVLVNLIEDYADLTYTLPSFTIGGGNVQFLTYEDFLNFYNIDKKH